VRRAATTKRVLPAPTDEDFFIRTATEALMSLIADLRRRLERTGTRRSAAQALLAEAHMDEAVHLLRTIQPTPSVHESGFRRSELTPARPTCSRVPLPGRPHQAHGVGVEREPFRIAPRSTSSRDLRAPTS
jgi:hypothetical protein